MVIDSPKLCTVRETSGRECDRRVQARAKKIDTAKRVSKRNACKPYAMCTLKTREDIMLCVFCTYAILFGRFPCASFVFTVQKTTYYGYINIMNILMIRNECGFCMCGRIEAKSKSALAKGRESPTKHELCDFEWEWKRMRINELMWIGFRSWFRLFGIRNRIDGVFEPILWCSSSCGHCQPVLICLTSQMKYEMECLKCVTNGRANDSDRLQKKIDAVQQTFINQSIR